MHYQNYYSEQVGGSVHRVFVGGHNQRGHGVGSIFSNILRRVLPLLKSGVRTVGNEALRAGLGVLTDVATQNISPKDSLRSRFRESSANLKRKADEKLDKVMEGRGYKAQRFGISPHLLNTLGAVQNSVKKKRKKKGERTG